VSFAMTINKAQGQTICMLVLTSWIRCSHMDSYMS